MAWGIFDAITRTKDETDVELVERVKQRERELTAQGFVTCYQWHRGNADAELLCLMENGTFVRY